MNPSRKNIRKILAEEWGRGKNILPALQSEEDRSCISYYVRRGKIVLSCL